MNILAILVHLELDNDDLAWVNANIGRGSISLLPLDPLDIDPELTSVALDNLANLLTLVVTTHYLYFIILPDRDAPHIVLGPQFLREGGRHEAGPYMGRGGKMPFTAFRPVGGNIFVKLHLYPLGVDMRRRLIWEGAEKCLLRLLDR